jgi:Fe-S cluster assembly protein SufD
MSDQESKGRIPEAQDMSLNAGQINAIDSAYSFMKSRLGSLPPSSLMRRDAAITAATQMGYPSTRHEDWRYTSLRPFAEKNFKVSIKSPKTDIARADLDSISSQLIPESIKLVFVDGELSIGLSDTRLAGSDLSIKTLLEAEIFDDVFWKDVDKTPGVNQTFGQMSIGMADHGLVIKIAPRCQAKSIHIVHLNSPASENISRSSRIIIEGQRLCSVRVFEEFLTIGSVSHHVNSLTQVIAREGSDVGYYRIDGMGPNSFATNTVTVTLEHNAKVECMSLSAGSRFSRSNIDVTYGGEGAECTIDGLLLLRDEQHCDHHTRIDHLAPKCITRQLYKSILMGSSRAVFNGKILIPHGAHGSEAYQTNKNLLLSANAEVNTKPELLIDNNDVKATHGAAVGAIDAKELFYLQTRGIDKNVAEAILSRGFADEVIMRIEDITARSALSLRIMSWFNKSLS